MSVRVRSCSIFHGKYMFVFVRVRHFRKNTCSCSFVFVIFAKITCSCSVRVHVRSRFNKIFKLVNLGLQSPQKEKMLAKMSAKSVQKQTVHKLEKY